MQTIKGVFIGVLAGVCIAAAVIIFRKFKDLLTDRGRNGNIDTKLADSSASIDAIGTELDGLQDAIRNAQNAINESIGLLEEVKKRQ